MTLRHSPLQPLNLYGHISCSTYTSTTSGTTCPVGGTGVVTYRTCLRPAGIPSSADTLLWGPFVLACIIFNYVFLVNFGTAPTTVEDC